MRVEVGRYYHYKYTGDLTKGGVSFLEDIFQILEIRGNCEGRFVIYRKSFLSGRNQEWYVDRNFWDKHVKELSLDEIMVEEL